MVDVYGAVTSVSLCSPVVDVSQSGTATVSHSLNNVLMPVDNTSVDMCRESAEADDVTMAAVVCVFTVFLL